MQVGKTGTDCKADLEMLSLHNLREAMPGLWQQPPDSQHPEVVYAHPPLTGPTAAAMAQGVPDIPGDILEEYRRRAIKVAAGERLLQHTLRCGLCMSPWLQDIGVVILDADVQYP